MGGTDPLLLAIDQGTGSTKAMLVDAGGAVVASAAASIGQSHPRPGWVEQDPAEIWGSVRRSVRDCVREDLAGRVVGVGLSVQRESVVIWERGTGEAVTPLLGWQDQRTAHRALELADDAAYVFSRTGLPLDPMFSALKAEWLLDRLDPDRERSRTGQWCLGTLDAWLLAQLGDQFGDRGRGAEVTEIGNASRTQLLDLGSGDWDPTLLDLFGIPRQALPEVVSSIGPFPRVSGLAPLPDGVPVLAVMGDSHAALFAQAGWRPGVVKATYGTGSSVMALGPRPSPASGVCGTIAWGTDRSAYALEANIRSTGRTMTWLAELLDVDVEVLFEEAETHASDGVMVVPAFGGLGAPWWDRDAKALLVGLSLGTRRAQLARAAVESIVCQVDDVLAAFRTVMGPVRELACDGGLTRSTSLMQLQANLSQVDVRVAATENLSALGVANLAGIQAGLWTHHDLEQRTGHAPADPESRELRLHPRDGADAATRDELRRRWRDALTRARATASRSDAAGTPLRGP